MKEVIIFGAGNLGKKLISELEKNEEVSVIGLADNSGKSAINGYPIIDIENEKKFSGDIIIAITKLQSAVDVYNQLKANGYQKIFYYNPNIGGIPEAEFGNLFLINCQKWGDCVLPQVEMHIADWCNLNCRGCTHFSPIFSRQMPELKVRLRDVLKLKELFSHVVVFYILGGEPFLNPQLGQYIQEIRNILPETRIVLVTNGILILRVDEKLLECIKANEVLVSISEYEPVHAIIDQITERLDRFDIKYQLRVFDRKQKFNLPLSLNSNSIYAHKCISDGCINICDGEIARCPTLMYINRLNQVFDINLPNDGIINLQDVQDGKELLNILREKVPLCKHCVEHVIPWSKCGKDVVISDFAVEE